jgi:dynein heavy chain
MPRLKLSAKVKTQQLTSYDTSINQTKIQTGDLEAMGDAMVRGQVPAIWAVAAYPSLMPLGAWVSDLALRLEGFSQWIKQGAPPPAFWISGFFFTQGFLTGTLQNFARRHRLPIDTLQFDYEVLPASRTGITITEAPDKVRV